MASVTFTNNYIDTSANAAVAHIDLGFSSASNLTNNNAQTQSAISGSSTTATVHYNNNNPAPLQFTVSTQVSFPEGAPVTITLGGPNDNTLVATDNKDNVGVWTVV